MIIEPNALTVSRLPQKFQLCNMHNVYYVLVLYAQASSRDASWNSIIKSITINSMRGLNDPAIAIQYTHKHTRVQLVQSIEVIGYTESHFATALIEFFASGCSNYLQFCNTVSSISFILPFAFTADLNMIRVIFVANDTYISDFIRVYVCVNWVHWKESRFSLNWIQFESKQNDEKCMVHGYEPKTLPAM